MSISIDKRWSFLMGGGFCYRGLAFDRDQAIYVGRTRATSLSIRDLYTLRGQKS